MGSSGEQIEHFLDSLPIGFTYGVHERLAVNQLLLSLAERGEFPDDPRALKTLLAPLVCSSRDQQQELYERFDREWSGEPPPAPGPAADSGKEHGSRWWIWLIACLLACAAAAGALAAWRWIRTPDQVLKWSLPTPRPPDSAFRTTPGATVTISGKVLSDTGLPIPGAEVWIPGQSQQTGDDGAFRFTAQSSAGPEPILVAHPEYRAKMTVAGSPGTGATVVKPQPLTGFLPPAGGLAPFGDAQSFAVADPTEALVSPDGNIAAIRSGNKIALWNLSLHRELPGLSMDPTVAAVSFSQDGQLLTMGGGNKHLAWTIATGERYTGRDPVAVATPYMHGPARVAVGSGPYISRDGRYILGVERDRVARISGTNQTPPLLIPLPAAVVGAQFDSTRYVAIRTGNGQASVFDAATGKKLQVPSGWPANIIGLGFSGTGDRLILAAADRTLPNRLGPLRWLAAALPALVISLWLFWIYRTRARLRRLSLPEGLDTYALKAPPAEAPFRSAPVRRLGLEMRRRKPAPSLDLAVEPTVRATVGRAGFLTPVYASRTLQREFLVLVQRIGVADQQERLYQALAEAFRAQGALIDIYTFLGSPERIRDAKTGGWLDLEELAARHPHHDLWIFADPADFPEPYSAALPAWISALSRWQDRAVLSPVAVDSRLRAMLEAEGLRVGTASVDGLAAMLRVTESDRATRPGEAANYPDSLRHIPLRWVERSSPGDDAIGVMLRELDAYLGPDGMLLAGACSVYPETFWPLTLWLAGRLFPDASRRDAVLARLTVLPWFRHGRTPDWARAQLVNRLGPDAGAVRQLIEEFLAKAERAGKAGEGDLTIARNDRGEKGQLRDYVMFSFLLGRRVDAQLAVKPPSAWLRLLFEGGRFVFGPRLWIYGVAAVVLGFGAWAAYDALLARLPARVVLTQWKLPEPVLVPPPRVLPVDSSRRAIVEVADAMVGQPAASSFETAVISRAAQFLGGSGYQARGAQPAPGVAYDGGFIESVAGSKVMAIESQAGRIQRVERPLPPGPFRTYSGQRTNPIDGQIYVWIPPGSFMMGCSPGDTECSDAEKPAHRVGIAHGFWLGQTDVTEAAYQRVMGTNPSDFKGANLPVHEVSWNDARAYCGRVGGRLPTEAEWEYAARAGTTGARYGALDAVAWYSENSGPEIHPAAQKQPNAWGLYDMLGNVWQWTADWYEPYEQKASTDPKGAASGQARVVRGGAWNYNPRNVRVSGRLRNVPTFRNSSLGFRCAGELR